jgi:folate-binding protein YgfZ
MTECRIAELPDRAVAELGGEDVFGFLQNIVTGNVEAARGGGAIHTALLTPQGKILFDFLLVGRDEGFLIDAPRAMMGDVIKRLTFYKLRAKVDITDRSGDYTVCAAWGGEPRADSDAVVYTDPRLPALGCRVIAPAGADIAGFGCERASEADYHAHRIALGVPEGGLDSAYGDTFPHEADLDQLGGVDFAKGCFVGQEVVARMEHRGTARKRIVPVTGEGALTQGAEIRGGGPAIGTLGSVAGSTALATIRLDRAEKAYQEGKALEAGGVPVRLIQPGWASFTVPGAREDAA